MVIVIIYFDDKVDNLATDVWGGAGPDCCTQPVKAGNMGEVMKEVT